MNRSAGDIQEQIAFEITRNVAAYPVASSFMCRNFFQFDLKIGMNSPVAFVNVHSNAKTNKLLVE